MAYVLKVKTHFDAAHRLKDYDGKCNREHGHRWELEVELLGRELDKVNMLVDFGVVKKIVNGVVDELCDHWQLNETLREDNPTAEFIAQCLYRELKTRFVRVSLESITIWESPECSVTYHEMF